MTIMQDSRQPWRRGWRASLGNDASSTSCRTPCNTSPKWLNANRWPPISAVFDAPDRAEADRRLQLTVKKYAKSAPRLSAWMETNIPQGLTVFALPLTHRRKLRTTNMLERINEEIKRRTRVATLFPNEASALRLVSAVLVEISDDWETAKTYLNMETE